jgi:poly-gamma-glutamate synthesis protein (capsule biosynthesis protein)
MAPSGTIKGIESLHPTLLTLANNHILDHGAAGLTNTMSLLRNSGIPWVGAGNDLAEASKPVIMEKNGWKIGVYGCAENEFSIAGQDTPGANPFDLFDSPDHIARLKSECDYVIILHHGGKEQYRYPTPELQRVCRKMVNMGADLVVCQHSHCIGASEKFGNGTIIYGQGNFLFDRHDNEYYQSGLLIRINLGTEIEVGYLPIVKSGNGVALPNKVTEEQILNGFLKRSEEIRDHDFIEYEFKKYCKEKGQYYLATLAGLGENVRRLDKLFGRPLTRLIYSRGKLNTVQNHFACETHREIILKYLEILKAGKTR